MDTKTRQSTLGGLLRGLRARHGWTLKQASERIAIPVSTLSKVEHDRLTLTYDKLLQISQRLNLRLSELFAAADGASEPAVTARRSIGRVDEAVRVETRNYDYHYLCAELRHKRMIPIYTRIRARSLAEFGDFVRHSGEEFIYVLDGAIVVYTEFYDPLTLAAGESIYIDSTMGHAFVAAPGHAQASVLAVCSSADEEGLLESLYSMRETAPPPKPRALKPGARTRLSRPSAKSASGGTAHPEQQQRQRRQRTQRR